MFLVGFAIPIAQQVIAQFISEFVSGRRRAASRREMQTMLDRLIAARYERLSPVQAEAVNRYALSEIRHLAEDHPDLEWRLNRLRPRAVPEQPSSSPDVNRLIAAQLRELRELVRTRRLALGLPTAPDSPGSDSGGFPGPDAAGFAGPDAGSEVLPLDTVEPPSSRDYWQDKVARANQDIASWRAKFGTADDTARKEGQAGDHR